MCTNNIISEKSGTFKVTCNFSMSGYTHANDKINDVDIIHE